MTDLPAPRIVFFDGVCHLCDNSIQFLIKRDSKGLLRYASLQGETAAEMLHGGKHPINLDSMVFVEMKDGRIIEHRRSKAAANIAKYLPWPWRIASIGRWVPAFIGNFFYNIVAKNRYKWFGKMDACALPTPEQRKLFLP